MYKLVNLSASARQIKEHYSVNFPDEANYIMQGWVNGLKHEPYPIITNENPGEISMFNWGLIPSLMPTLMIYQLSDFSLCMDIKDFCAKTDKKMGIERGVWRKDRKQRCLIPVTGIFFQDKRKGSEGHYLIKATGQEIFSLAGIWNRCIDKLSDDQQEVNSFTILTRSVKWRSKAFGSIRSFPIILDDEKAWLEKGQLKLKFHNQLSFDNFHAEPEFTNYWLKMIDRQPGFVTGIPLRP